MLSIGWLERTGDKGKASLLQLAVWHAQKRRVLGSRMLSYVFLREHAQLTYQATSSSSNCCELNLSWNTIRAKTKKGQTKCSFFNGNYLFLAIFADSHYLRLFRSTVSKAVFFIPITHDITLLTFAFCLITSVQLFVVPRERNYLTHRGHAQSQRA